MICELKIAVITITILNEIENIIEDRIEIENLLFVVHLSVTSQLFD